VREEKQIADRRAKQKEKAEGAEDGPPQLNINIGQDDGEGSVRSMEESIDGVVRVQKEEPNEVEEVEKLFEVDPTTGFGQEAVSQEAVKVPGYCYKTLRCYLMNGRIQGQVLIQTHDGCKYEGPWSEEDGYVAPFTHLPTHALKDGQGTIGKWTMVDGTVYQGEQVNGSHDCVLP